MSSSDRNTEKQALVNDIAPSSDGQSEFSAPSKFDLTPTSRKMETEAVARRQSSDF